MIVQCQALNKLLDTGDKSFLTSNNLTPDFFSDYPNEYQFIKNHIDQYGSVPDKATFISEFPQFDVVAVNEPDNYLIDQLYEDKNRRTLAKIFNKVRDLLNAGKTDEAAKLYTSAADQLVKAQHIQSVDLFHDTSRYTTYTEKINNFDKYYVSTGFKELDEVIGGWDRQEELATIVARPGVGKSQVAIRVAVSAAEQGLTVGMYSGEMSETKVGYRVDTFISHISNTKITKGNGDVQVEYKKYLEDLPSRFKGTIKVLTPAMVGGPVGVSALRAFVEREHLDMLVVDQHSLLEDDRKGRGPVEKAANISRDIKNLQVMTKIPVIAVSQQNRESTEKGVGTEHVSQSDRISQDSTIILFLEKKDDILTLDLVKSRDGGSGKKLKYVVNWDKGVFQYVPSEGDATNGAHCEELEKEYEYQETDQEGVF